MATTDVEAEKRGPRSRLVAVTAEVMAERGIEATRLSDVASEAGVSIGLLQHYFGSRDALIGEAIAFVAESKFARLSDELQGSDDPWLRIVAAIDEVLATPTPIRDARSWIDLCAAAARSGRLRPTVQEVQERWIGWIEAAIVDGVDGGSFEPRSSAAEAARAINALIDGMDLALASGGAADADLDPVEMRDIAERAAERLVGRVTPDGPSG